MPSPATRQSLRRLPNSEREPTHAGAYRGLCLHAGPGGKAGAVVELRGPSGGRVNGPPRRSARTQGKSWIVVQATCAAPSLVILCEHVGDVGNCQSERTCESVNSPPLRPTNVTMLDAAQRLASDARASGNFTLTEPERLAARGEQKCW